MNSIDANIRDNSTKGQLNSIRNNGNVPGIVYGGELPNEKISISTKEIKNLDVHNPDKVRTNVDFPPGQSSQTIIYDYKNNITV